MLNYLIIGNGVAGTFAADNIRKADPEGNITMVTAEDLPFYYRLRLNEFIAGDLPAEKLIAKTSQWYEEKNITLLLRTRMVDVVPQERVLITDAGRQFPFDRLLLASGSHSFLPPIGGVDKKGVFTLRTMEDARAIKEYAARIEAAVLIGGGLLGLETGNALRKLGKKVTVVEYFPRLLPRQLDPAGALRLKEIMIGMGFDFRLGIQKQEITGEERVAGVLLDSGERLPAQMAIISAGVRPNLDLARPLGLTCDKGVKVDGYLRTSRPEVYAAGDVAEFNGVLYGIWPAAMEQGRIAGTNMAGGQLLYEGSVMANVLKVVGIDLASAGDIDPEDKLESRVVASPDVYKKLVLEDNRIKGCIMLGDTGGFNRLKNAMAERRDVSELKDRLLADPEILT